MGKPLQGQIGFVGLGHMGGPVARHLARSGARVAAHDLRPGAVAAVTADGAVGAGSPAELMDTCETIAVCVVDDQQVQAVLAGPDGLFSRPRSGTTVVVHSTVAPATVIELAARGAELGIAVLDAPVSGNIEKRSSGQLTVFVGGSESDYAAVRPYLAMIGTNVAHLGPTGAGLIGKLCNNLMLFCNTLGAFEAVQIASDYGIHEDAMVGSAAAGTGGSWVLDTWGWFDDLMVEHTMGDVESVLDFLQRDLTYVQEAAEARGRRLDIGAHVAELMRPMFKARHARTAGGERSADTEEGAT